MVTALVPHAGGPILPPCCPTVVIGMMPAARVGDMATCVGPPDAIAKGSTTVMIGMKPAARQGDPTLHGGVIVLGFPMVIIGDLAAVPGMAPLAAAAAINQALKDLSAMLRAKKAALQRWDAAAQADFMTYFGKTDEASRKNIMDRIDRMQALIDSMTLDNFKIADPSRPKIYAYVYPNDKTHTVYLDQAFATAPATGTDSKAGTLGHEMSHFNDIGGTEDHVYGSDDAKQTAKDAPDTALDNADNFEYYLEGG
jgi:uncharacterized Zn-binding protein involved in type VI secretion